MKYPIFMQSTVNNSSQLNGRSKAKHWVATINNYTDVEIGKFKDIEQFASYYIYGKEVGDGGTMHLQCYMAFSTQKTLATLTKWFPTAHFDIMRGTPQQASEYCKKDRDFVEFGELPKHLGAGSASGGEATKVKWLLITEQAKRGEMETIRETAPAIWLQSYKTLKQIGFDNEKKPDDLEDVCGEWIYGETGVGKSYTARDENPNHFDKMINKWWDHYNKEEVIILDDFGPEHKCLGHHLQRWSDRYTFPVEIKNFVRFIRPKKIVVTSQYHPSEIWNEDKDKNMLDSLLRRFKLRHLIKMKSKDSMKAPRKRGFEEISINKVKKHDKPFLKKPALFRRSKDGALVPNVSIQPTIESKMSLRYGNASSKLDTKRAIMECCECNGKGGECGSCDQCCGCICHGYNWKDGTYRYPDDDSDLEILPNGVLDLTSLSDDSSVCKRCEDTLSQCKCNDSGSDDDVLTQYEGENYDKEGTQHHKLMFDDDF